MGSFVWIAMQNVSQNVMHRAHRDLEISGNPTFAYPHPPFHKAVVISSNDVKATSLIPLPDFTLNDSVF